MRTAAPRRKNRKLAVQLPRSRLQRAVSDGQIRDMGKHTETHIENDRHEPVIEALLSHHEADSIVDLLLSLPSATSDQPDTFERVVEHRLAAKLADRMRSLIDDGHSDAA